MIHEEKNHGPQNTLAAGMLIEDTKRRIAAKLAEDQATARLAAIRADIRAKRDRRGVPGGGIVWGVLGGLALWIVAAVIIYLALVAR